MAEPARVEFARDSPLEESGFEPSIPRIAGTRIRLLTLDHEELVGCGFGAPDLAFATSKLPDTGVAVGQRKGFEPCMGLFLSSSHFWFVGGSLFGAGKPFFVPSPALRFAERAEGVKGPKR